MEGVAVKAEPVTVETVVAKLSNLLTVLRESCVEPTVIGQYFRQVRNESVCLSICSVCLSVNQCSVCLSVCLSVCQSVLCLSVCLSISALSVCLPISALCLSVQVFYMINAHLMNNLLLRKDLCHWSHGLQIR